MAPQRTAFHSLQNKPYFNLAPLASRRNVIRRQTRRNYRNRRAERLKPITAARKTCNDLYHHIQGHVENSNAQTQNNKPVLQSLQNIRNEFCLKQSIQPTPQNIHQPHSSSYDHQNVTSYTSTIVQDDSRFVTSHFEIEQLPCHYQPETKVKHSESFTHDTCTTSNRENVSDYCNEINGNNSNASIMLDINSNQDMDISNRNNILRHELQLELPQNQMEGDGSNTNKKEYDIPTPIQKAIDLWVHISPRRKVSHVRIFGN